jgi:hypothetical protein
MQSYSLLLGLTARCESAQALALRSVAVPYRNLCTTRPAGPDAQHSAATARGKQQ